jgi:hypothetical protein
LVNTKVKISSEIIKEIMTMTNKGLQMAKDRRPSQANQDHQNSINSSLDQLEEGSTTSAGGTEEISSSGGGTATTRGSSGNKDNGKLQMARPGMGLMDDPRN